jgi:hypothetical protein
MQISLFSQERADGPELGLFARLTCVGAGGNSYRYLILPNTVRCATGEDYKYMNYYNIVKRNGTGSLPVTIGDVPG